MADINRRGAVDYVNTNMTLPIHLRGTASLHDDVHMEEYSQEHTRSLQDNSIGGGADDDLVLTQSSLFQIAISVVLGSIALGQIILLASFIRNQSNRVLEFAQPAAICLLVASGAITTCACYFFIYVDNVGCAIRGPIIMVSITIMTASIAGRSWRISTLLSNPLVHAGSNSVGNAPRVERSRQILIQALNAVSGCNFNALNLMRTRPNNVRVRVSFWQMI